MNSGIYIDQEHVLRIFSQLDTTHMAKAHRTAMARSLKVLVNETRIQLQGVTTRAHSTRTSSRKGWNNKGGKGAATLVGGIRMRVHSDGKMGKVHIMGDHRLKWFEMGTVIRAKKSGASTGAMTARPFFATAKAVASYKMKAEFERSIARYVDIIQKK